MSLPTIYYPISQMKNKKKRTGLWILLAVAVIGVGIAIASSKRKKEPTKVEYAEVVKRTIYARVTESGTIQPTIEVPIAPDVSGEVVELYVKEGQQVKKGQLLAVIRPDNYKAALEQSQASVNMSQADYSQAQASINQTRVNMTQDSVNVERVRKLHKEKIVSDSDLENAILKLNLSKSQYEATKYTIQAAFYRLKSAEASLKQAQQNLNRTNIYASMDGTITRLNVEVGQRVVGTMQMAGTEMMKIADLQSMEVVVEINENDIVNLNLGDSALIEVDAFPNKKFFGQVTDVAYSATKSALGTSDQVTSFEVKVRILPTSYADMMKTAGEIPSTNLSPFRPGMSALVEIFTDKVEDVVAVPLQSVTLHREKVVEEKSKSPWGGDSEVKTDEKTKPADKKDIKEVVFVYDNGKVKEMPVKTGIADDTYIEIKDGISTGVKVVTGPYVVLTKELTDSMQVTGEPKR